MDRERLKPYRNPKQLENLPTLDLVAKLAKTTFDGLGLQLSQGFRSSEVLSRGSLRNFDAAGKIAKELLSRAPYIPTIMDRLI